MAKALDSGTLTAPETHIGSLHMVRALRLAFGSVILLGATLFFLGTSWDIQWHTYIGRDRTLIPPHIIMLLGITLCGISALSTVLIETFWAHRDAQVAQSSTQFADAFHGSLGAYIVGFGALDSAIGFPLDSYWHSLYGIDVQIWAPFHVMIIAGMAAAALGAVYMFVSTAHLAVRDSAPLARKLSHAGTLIALAVMLSTLTFLLFDAYGSMGTLTLALLPSTFLLRLLHFLGFIALLPRRMPYPGAGQQRVSWPFHLSLSSSSGSMYHLLRPCL